MHERTEPGLISGGYLVARPVRREGSFWDASLVEVGAEPAVWHAWALSRYPQRASVLVLETR
jgi:hypothetical protein